MRGSCLSSRPWRRSMIRMEKFSRSHSLFPARDIVWTRQQAALAARNSSSTLTFCSATFVNTVPHSLRVFAHTPNQSLEPTAGRAHELVIGYSLLVIGYWLLVLMADWGPASGGRLC